MKLGKKRRWARWLAGWAATGLLGLVVLWFACPPPLEDARRCPAGVVLCDRSGQVLRVGLGPDDQDCRPYYQASLDDWLVQATIAAEDKRFLSHQGVDPGAVLRAVWQNLTSRRRISGASTITMQTVRLILPHRRNLFWKVVESVQALRLERVMTKEEILRQYLNRAPFASNFVGAEAAAWGWFGKAPDQLNLAEASLLAGLLQSPTRFRPDRYPEAAKKRRTYVLDRMVTLAMVSEAQGKDAERVPLVLCRSPRPFAEPFFCDWVQHSERRFTGNYTTTLDRVVQQAVDERVARHAASQGCDVAVVVQEVKTGAVRAMSCSGDYFSVPDGQVNTAAMPRPAGSTLKPFAYALAIDRGQLTPGWVLADVPRRFGNDEPLNFSGAFMGLVTAREALILSLNLPALEVVEKVGQPLFYATLRQLGLEGLNRPAAHYGLGLVLGNGSVRLCELANAYACLARGGVWQPCRVIEESGGPSAMHAAGSRRVFSEGASWLVSEMLSGDERARDAVGHVADVRLPRFAWKTGTSSGFRDAWTVAWNPDCVVAVWCGFKSGRRGSETLVGKKAAAPLAWEIVRLLYPAGGAPWYGRPAEVVGRKVCAVSGRMPGPLCGQRVEDLALRQCSSCGICPVHVRDAEGGIRERWSQDVAAFLERTRPGGGEGPAAEGQVLRMVSPADGSVFRIADGVTFQRILFKVTGMAAGEAVYWFLNDLPVRTTVGTNPFSWAPERGTYRVVCSSASGHTASVKIRVE